MKCGLASEWAKYHHPPAAIGKSHLWEPIRGGRAISAHIRDACKKMSAEGRYA
jgi:hypothetical protein